MCAFIASEALYRAECHTTCSGGGSGREAQPVLAQPPPALLTNLSRPLCALSHPPAHTCARVRTHPRTVRARLRTPPTPATTRSHNHRRTCTRRWASWCSSTSGRCRGRARTGPSSPPSRRSSSSCSPAPRCAGGRAEAAAGGAADGGGQGSRAGRGGMQGGGRAAGESRRDRGGRAGKQAGMQAGVGGG